MKTKSLEEYSVELASKAPVPGGGGTSALAGALGAALGSMVGNLTTGKKKYAEYEEDIQRLMKQCEQLRQELLALCEKDAEVFEPLSKAYGLPKSTPEELEIRNRVMEEALNAASQVPYQIAQKAVQGISYLEELAKKGSRLAVSDVGVGAEFFRTALNGAVLNVYINTKLMKNREKAEQLNQSCRCLAEEGSTRADAVYEAVRRQLLG